MSPIVAIKVEGGVIQDIVTSGSVRVCVIDHDTEGADECDTAMLGEDRVFPSVWVPERNPEEAQRLFTFCEQNVWKPSQSAKLISLQFTVT